MKKILLIILFIIIFLPFRAEALLKDNLVSYWKMEEASGTRVDVHGSNDLTDWNTVTTATGKIGEAADFEFDNSESLYITDNPSTSPTGDVSLNLWIKFESSSGENTAIISKWGDGGSNLNSFRFYFGLSVANNPVRFEISDNGSAVTSISRDYVGFELGVFHMYTVTYDASAGESKLYVDGTQLGSTATGQKTSLFESTAVFAFGNLSGSTVPRNIDEFDGIMDEVSFHTKVLTGAEITEIYNSGSGLGYDSWDVVEAPPVSDLWIDFSMIWEGIKNLWDKLT